MERMEKQLTAVEWLEKEFQEIFKEWGGLDTNWLKRFEQAKAMEKEQIIHAWDNGWHEHMNPPNTYITSVKYYNETFKSE